LCCSAGSTSASRCRRRGCSRRVAGPTSRPPTPRGPPTTRARRTTGRTATSCSSAGEPATAEQSTPIRIRPGCSRSQVALPRGPEPGKEPPPGHGGPRNRSRLRRRPPRGSSAETRPFPRGEVAVKGLTSRSETRSARGARSEPIGTDARARTALRFCHRLQRRPVPERRDIEPTGCRRTR
jgi:hypothetical protein